MSIRVKKGYEDNWARARYKTSQDSSGNKIVFCCWSNHQRKVNEETNISV